MKSILNLVCTVNNSTLCSIVNSVDISWICWTPGSRFVPNQLIRPLPRRNFIMLCATRTTTGGHTSNCYHPIESRRGGEGIIYHVILPFSFVSPIGSLLYSFTVFKSILPLPCREKDKLTSVFHASVMLLTINCVITLSKHEATDEWMRRRIIARNLSTV